MTPQRMTPQEKINWFWATGVLPGTIFDDWDDNGHRQSKTSGRDHSWLWLIFFGLLMILSF